jgi:hypothetical protein
MAIISNGTTIIDNGSLASGIGGKVLQTKYYQTGASVTNTSTSFSDLGSFSLSITPSSTSSVILLSANFGSCYGGADNNTVAFRFMRGTTAVAIGDTVGSRDRASFRTSSVTKLINGDTNHSLGLAFTAIDAPSSTSALTYKIQVENEYTTGVFINRNVTFNAGTEIYKSMFFSSFIAQEIGA